MAATTVAQLAAELNRPAATLLPPNGRWNALIQAISTYYNGTELENVSVIDLDRYVDTGTNWRIAEGYGTFVTGAAAPLTVRCACPVRAIDHSGGILRIDTDAGMVHVPTWRPV